MAERLRAGLYELHTAAHYGTAIVFQWLSGRFVPIINGALEEAERRGWSRWNHG